MQLTLRHASPCAVKQEHSSRFNPASGLCSEPGKLVKELRLVGVQVGCVLGKSGENIGQIRKVCTLRKHAEDEEAHFAARSTLCG